ncbi:MAG: hypothetical protein KME60_03370 [Cyanomargarita calcarea GSE-NOS-MK-12-04C]|jgi:hypothetical protein|uniref:Uncharacterized protein n=1 Tax=Cyanomargarita calcarea GSE-NOS-MK-12-04C TaxID=2839659 RepID=A0A951QJH8_9CYAN|nr:hypothetical protein [Cyanomargarita calcarea GSE-NOS-MK-12-04C]
MLTSVNQKDIDNWFIYHQPKGDQVDRYQVIRDVGKKVAIAIFDSGLDLAEAVIELGETIIRLCPDGVEKVYAMGHCRTINRIFRERGAYHAICCLRFQVIMPANAAIACNE